MANSADLDVNDYQALAEFRYQIRKFLRFSEAAAREAGSVVASGKRRARRVSLRLNAGRLPVERQKSLRSAKS
jgi:hypothetical protein